MNTSVKVISDQLGHASISFTLERYSHILPSIQDEAAAKVERMLMEPSPGTILELRGRVSMTRPAQCASAYLPSNS
jgi:hypothetical protein